MSTVQSDPWLAAYDLRPPIELFALPGQGSFNRTVGIRTGAGNFVAKTYSSRSEPQGIRYEHHLLAWLANAGLSFGIPVAVEARSGETLCRVPKGWVALAVQLPGHPLDWRQTDQLEAMGQAMGELHLALSGYPALPRPDLPPFGDVVQSGPPALEPSARTLQRLGWPITPSTHELLRWWQDELSQVQAFADQSYQSLPRQVIHRDFDPSNTLVSAGQITGLLDFEFAGLEVRALDVAATLKYTMRAWENTEPWTAARMFCRGYGRTNSMTQAEATAIAWLTRLREAASLCLRFRQALITGNTGPLLSRLQAMQGYTQWLQENGQRLLDIATYEMCQ